jgi:hypothetical protein
VHEDLCTYCALIEKYSNSYRASQKVLNDL